VSRMRDGCQEPVAGGMGWAGERPSSQAWEPWTWCRPPRAPVPGLPARAENFLVHPCDHTRCVGFAEMGVPFEHRESLKYLSKSNLVF
jgi:hypothetical protein